MRISRYLLLFSAVSILSSQIVFADNTEKPTDISVESTEQSKDKEPKKQKNSGTLTGSFETNSIFYVEDASVPNYQVPPGNYGSNNFLKLEYRNGNWVAGLQAEYYPQALMGYEKTINGLSLPMKYVSYNGKNFSVTLGDFYEQLGSGLLYRSYEDRFLGINNSVGGARFTLNATDYLQFKAFYGVPRNYMGYSRSFDPNGQVQVPSGLDFFDTNEFNGLTLLAGGDVSFDLSTLLNLYEHRIVLEGSILHKTETMLDPLLPTTVDGKDIPMSNISYSARAIYEWDRIAFKAEYVGRQADLYFNNKTGQAELRPGNAQLIEMNYSDGPLSVMGTFRRLDNMQTNLYRTTNLYPSNSLNYIPALSMQQGYSLALMKPLSAYANGEVGGQLDVFYNFKRGTTLGGKRGMKVHANASYVHSLEKANKQDFSPLVYRDITMDVEKWWNKNLKTVFLVTIQEISEDGGKGNMGTTIANNVFVADVTYKFTRKTSMRAEVQYLYSQEYQGDWVSALLELNVAPKWSFYVSDMYNIGRKVDGVMLGDQLHYYSVGTSFTHKNLRVALNYGRNREGYVCSGGVCRVQPAYTGLNLMMSLIF